MSMSIQSIYILQSLQSVTVCVLHFIHFCNNLIVIIIIRVAFYTTVRLITKKKNKKTDKMNGRFLFRFTFQNLFAYQNDSVLYMCLCILTGAIAGWQYIPGIRAYDSTIR